jgi:cyanate lyase
MNKLLMTEEILAKKHASKKTWADIAAAIGLSEVFTTSACLGQNTLDKSAAEKLGSILNLTPETVACLQLYPIKGTGQTISTDPLIYRFFEICFVYGTTLKEIIQEKFGEGIMSAIDYTMHIDKIEDPKGDRVKITMNGKFLPYKKW